MKTKIEYPFFLACLFIFLIPSLSAQIKPKFGKIDLESLEMTTYEQDTGAHAVFLFDIGYARIEYDKSGDNGWQVHMDRHVRIKILDQNGLEWGDVELGQYQSGSNKEKVGSIKAMTYNIENGTIEKTKMSNKDIFTEKIDKNRSKVKFAMPGIKVGSVIEYKYTLISDYIYSFNEWQFQTSIPVIWSEYRTRIPDYFIYNKTFKGYDFGEMVINEQSQQPDGIDFGGGDRIDFVSNTNHWGYKNIPAFKLEAYSTTPKNYLSRVDFELSSYNVPGQMTQSFNQSWEDINRKLLTAEDFGGQLNKLGVVKEEARTLTANLEKPMEKIGALYEYVKGAIAWDGDYRMFINESVRKAYKEKKGSSADINFVLINMLKAAGLDAHPVLVSTRTNGFINYAHPSIKQFNHVIVAVMLGERYLLLDATHNLLPATILHPDNLNNKGRLIHPESSNWIGLDAQAKYRKVTQAKLQLTEDGSLEGNLKYLYQDYAAYAFRNSYHSAENEAEFIEEMQTENEGLEIQEFKFENVDNIYERITCNYDVTINEKAIDAGDLMYLSPMLFYGTEENPFKLDDRKYPVDYSFPLENICSFQISIPEGYTIEELPEGVNLSLPEKGAQFTFSVKANNNLIQVTSRLKINKSIFISEEYAGLKEFYNLIVDKHAAQVVLKKKT